MSLEKLTKDVQTIAVVCNQWGDTGKGKFSDYFASEWAEVIARGTGGNNAGHTVMINGQERIFHLLPTGIAYDRLGKISILGNGMVIDLEALVKEIDQLKEDNITCDNLMISEDAHIIMPYHVKRDLNVNTSLKSGGIGSTGRGIGPTYADKIARRGISVRDLFSEDLLFKKIKKAIDFYQDMPIPISDIIEELKPLAEQIKPYVRDTIKEMHGFLKQGKKVLLEGAQGLLLSIEYGTYPYVTSSDCSINGTAAGVGISVGAVNLTLGVVKFPYMTRVGGGPFPTELGGFDSERYCAEGLAHNLEYELREYEVPYEERDGKLIYNHHDKRILELVNCNQSFYRGIGVRLAGYEYGATTGRPRRTGWTDLVALKYAVNINGPNLILTKPDVFTGAREFKLGIEYDGLEEFTRDSQRLYKTKVSYKKFEGFDQDIAGIRQYYELPETLKDAIAYMEEFTGGDVRLISTGPEAKNTIVK